jgi:hypothetical protein
LFFFFFFVSFFGFHLIDVLFCSWFFIILTATNAGVVYLVYGCHGNLPDMDLANMTVTQGAYFTGSSGEQLGYVVEAMGDVNGDTYDDVMIGLNFFELIFSLFLKTFFFLFLLLKRFRLRSV